MTGRACSQIHRRLPETTFWVGISAAAPPGWILTVMVTVAGLVGGLVMLAVSLWGSHAALASFLSAEGCSTGGSGDSV